jgi:hypothetical protein
MTDRAKGAFIRVSPRALREVSPELRGDLRQMFGRAGLSFTEEGEAAIRIRSDDDTSGLVVEIPLQTANGRLRGDVLKRLERGGLGFDSAASGMFRSAANQYGVALSHLGALELTLMQATSPEALVDELTRLVESQAQGGGPVRLVRLLSTNRLFTRLFLLDLIDGLLAGVSVSEFRKRARGSWISGLVELQPQAIVCPPLIARSQPLAAVLMTPFLAAVVLLQRKGTFVREVDMSAWPTGMSALRLGGPGKGVYTGMKTIPDHHAETMLSLYVRASNRLLQHLTAPEKWVDESGEFQSDERRMAWTSLRIGLDAVASVGAEWGSRQAIWEAFRALSVLASFWGDDVRLASVMTPDHLRTHAVAAIPDVAERGHASGIVDKYEETIKKAFGDNAPGKVAQVRNLVHGVASRGRDRTLRLQVLHEIEESSPDLQLVQDVATLWWQAVLLSPETHARPGRPPWTSP